MNAEVEFKPPPHSRMMDDNQTNWRGNILGYAPVGLSTQNASMTRSEYLQTTNISLNDTATPINASIMIFLRPKRSPSFPVGMATSSTTLCKTTSNIVIRRKTYQESYQK